MYQAWLLVRDVQPFEAIRSGDDEAICGACAHRTGEKRTCYVSMFKGPTQIWKRLDRGAYRRTTIEETTRYLAGETLRVTAYGDGALLPFEFWQAILSQAAGWVGYTHQWRTCDPRFRGLLMASVETSFEASIASRAGWRTFRARSAAAPLRPDEFICPASEESGHRTTCQRCQLCRGTASPAKSVAILLHGRVAAPKPKHILRGRHDQVRDELDATGYAVVAVDAQHPSSLVLLALKQFYLRRRMDVQLRSKRLRDGLHMFWRGDLSA